MILNYKSALLFLIFKCVLFSALAQNQTVNIPLETHTDATINTRFTFLYKGAYEKFKGIPSSLNNQNSIIKYRPINNQDTLFMIIGDLNEMERICIIDANFNNDFSDNYRYVYNKDVLTKNTVFPAQPIVFKSGGNEIETGFVCPVLFNSSVKSFGTENELQMKYFLMLGLSEYYTGVIKLNNQHYTLSVYPSGFNNLQEYFYSVQDSANIISISEKKPNDVAIVVDGFSIKPGEISKYKSSVKLEISPVSKVKDVNSMGVEPGFFATPFKKRDLSGKLISLNHLKGKYVLLDFWGTWCNPCVKLLPHIGEIHEKYKELEVISIAFETDKKGADRLPYFISKYKMEWTNICDKNFLSEENICSLYYVSSFPTTILIDPTGKIIHRGGSGNINELDQKLEKIFQNK